MYILYLIRYIRMTSLLSENFVTLNKFDPAPYFREKRV